MKKSYIKCPYCQDEVSISGSSMHVRNKHSDKYEEFKKNFAEIKKTAVIKESAIRTPVSRGPEPEKVEIPTSAYEAKASDTDAQRGDDKPKQGESFRQDQRKEQPQEARKSFLDEFNEWLDSPEL